ncbi:MAG TPA: response regulator [Terriglobales bacterium]|nr:response regulator [Terriglobales bacterium]
MLPSILLVEDSRFLRVASERALTKAGFTVITTGDGEEALRVAKDKVPDLILLDMLLPKLGGQEVLRLLKANTSTSHIPVVVLSSLSQANAEKLKEEGAVAYFEKSHLLLEGTPDLLIKTIERILAGPNRPADSLAARSKD